MKILFVIPSFAKGGQEKSGMQLCNFLMKYHDVTAVCFEKKNIDDFNYQCKKIRINIDTSNNIFKKIWNGYYRIQRLKNLKKALIPDVSIAFGNTAIILNSLSGIKEKKISSIRQSFHGFMRENSFSMKMHKALYKLALKRSEKIIAVNKNINTELKQFFNISNNNFINNGYDIEAIQKLSLQEVPLFNAHKLWLIHSGRFDLSKGHWHLIKIFIEIKKDFPQATLLLLGSLDAALALSQSIIDFCKTCIERNNLSWSDDETVLADVIFLGHQKNPFKFISKSDLFIFPSIWEGFPNALMEAMACGIPVTAADCQTGPREILIDSTSGEEFGLVLPAFNDTFDGLNFLPNPTDLDWSQQIKGLLKDKARLQFLKTQSKKRALQFSIEEMGNKWLKVIEE